MDIALFSHNLDECVSEHLCIKICLNACFQFGRYAPRKGIAGSYGNSTSVIDVFVEPLNFLPYMLVGFQAPGNLLLKIGLLVMRSDAVPSWPAINGDLASVSLLSG